MMCLRAVHVNDVHVVQREIDHHKISYHSSSNIWKSYGYRTIQVSLSLASPDIYRYYMGTEFCTAYDDDDDDDDTYRLHWTAILILLPYRENSIQINKF